MSHASPDSNAPDNNAPDDDAETGQLSVAIVHDWLTGMRGGESVLEAILELYPQAEIYTLLHVKGQVSPSIENRRIHTSPLQWMPWAAKKYRHYLPIMPLLVAFLRPKNCRLVISSSHCVAKGVRKPNGAVHVSYVHAPMRYIWFRFDDYFGPGRAGWFTRVAARLVRPFLQAWDRWVTRESRVDRLVANSGFISREMAKIYRRDSRVVHPFVEAERFQNPRRPEDFYLIVSAFAPNKRIDLAIQAFNTLDLPLRIVGGGQEEARLKEIAGPRIRFLGRVSDEDIADLYSRCKAFLLPGVEDFGITPLEAMAAGAPVIAFDEGGVRETVHSETGILFHPQTDAALIVAVREIEEGRRTFCEDKCRERAREFSRDRFLKQFQTIVREAVSQ